MNKEKSYWMLEYKGANLVIGLENKIFSAVSFTDIAALKFSIKGDADRFLEDHIGKCEKIIVTDHLFL